MDQQIDTKPIQDEQGRLIGYACEGAKNDVNINEVATSFFFGLQYPIGQQTAAIEYTNQALLEHVANDYHLISGTACNVLQDDSAVTSRYQSPLVSIQSNLNRVELFQSCNENPFFDPSLQDCQTMQLILTGLVWSAGGMPDVITHVERWLQGKDSDSSNNSNNSNNFYTIHYLGGQELEDYTVISTGSGRPSYPAYQQASDNDVSTNRNYVTGLYKMSPLGIAFACLLVLAFLCVILAFLRKQKLQRVRDQEQKRKREEKENKGDDFIVPEIDVEESESSNKSDLSVTGSSSAMSA